MVLGWSGKKCPTSQKSARPGLSRQPQKVPDLYKFVFWGGSPKSARPTQKVPDQVLKRPHCFVLDVRFLGFLKCADPHVEFLSGRMGGAPAGSFLCLCSCGLVSVSVFRLARFCFGVLVGSFLCLRSCGLVFVSVFLWARFCLCVPAGSFLCLCSCGLVSVSAFLWARFWQSVRVSVTHQTERQAAQHPAIFH